MPRMTSNSYLLRTEAVHDVEQQHSKKRQEERRAPGRSKSDPDGSAGRPKPPRRSKSSEQLPVGPETAVLSRRRKPSRTKSSCSEIDTMAAARPSMNTPDSSSSRTLNTTNSARTLLGRLLVRRTKSEDHMMPSQAAATAELPRPPTRKSSRTAPSRTMSTPMVIYCSTEEISNPSQQTNCNSKTKSEEYGQAQVVPARRISSKKRMVEASKLLGEMDPADRAAFLREMGMATATTAGAGGGPTEAAATA
jgi:hypothetical protein